MLTVETVTCDRYPIPGCEGGSYKRDNIRPMCGPCNSSSGGILGATRKAMKNGKPSKLGDDLVQGG
ncbi:HNH endonuclease [Gordonia phage Sixama]|uniref:HNH endonuclease n=1 Tax=Gordonia phage Sixama TaxID=2653271 RepID=A0A5Q2F860_9CAUD|nr:HNH endonuclease [Gordonia phage Sixama]QGF20326.1 HNH endonuclease [Gordonia phage Sixama]